jgi:hypothetical protein
MAELEVVDKPDVTKEGKRTSRPKVDAPPQACHQRTHQVVAGKRLLQSVRKYAALAARR